MLRVAEVTMIAALSVIATDTHSAGLTSDSLVVQSHRGAGVLAAENTIQAFELGWQLGTWPEADVRATSDGVIVAFHDADFKRALENPPAGLANKGVENVTFQQLMEMPIGELRNGRFERHRVPRITDVLARMSGKPERRLYLDIKKVNLQQLAQEVKQHGVESQVVLASREYSVLKTWRQMLPDSQTLLWVPGKEQEQDATLRMAEAAKFKDITQVQIHVHLKGTSESVTRISVDPFTPSDAFLRKTGETLRAHGILYQTLPYGGSTREIYCKLIDLGVDSFASDYPDVVMQAMRECRTRHE